MDQECFDTLGIAEYTDAATDKTILDGPTMLKLVLSQINPDTIV